jgi:hypothetical protein
MERPMRSTIAIAVVSIVVAATLPGVAQQPTPPTQPPPSAQPAPPAQPAAPAQTVVPTTPVVQPKQTRTARASRRRTGHVVRHRHESICSVVNGWRAFNNPYDPKGYFYTGRVCCCG